MMKYLSSLLLLLTFTAGSYAQADSAAFHLQRVVQGEDIVRFAVDNLDNLYILNSRNQLKKLNANGDSVAVYNDVKKYGQATFIDASNPLKVLLYYRDFATVVVLDRFLNAVNTIDLRRQNIFQAQAIAQSYDNKLWVYDELNGKLKKLDDDGKLLLETADFRQLFGEAPMPQKIFDQDQFVYLYDSAKAVFVFDYYGTLKSQVQVSHWDNFKVAGKYIYGNSAGILHRFELKTFRIDDWVMPSALYQSRAFNFTSSRLYALKEDRIEIYSYE